MSSSEASFSWTSLSRRSPALGATVAIIVGMDPHGPVPTGSARLHVSRRCHFAFARTRRAIFRRSLIGIALCRCLRNGHSADEQGYRGEPSISRICSSAIFSPLPARGDSKPRALQRYRLFHFIFRKKFLLISMNHDKAEQTGLNVRFWDFLFYALSDLWFLVGGIAGVLLVFCYLIVPGVGAMLFAIASARAWPSVGPWEHWSLRWSLSKREA